METDTHPRLQQFQIDLLRDAGFERRLAMALDLSQTVKQLALRGLAKTLPGASDLEVRLRMAELTYGRDLIAGVRRRLAVTEEQP